MRDARPVGGRLRAALAALALLAWALGVVACAGVVGRERAASEEEQRAYAAAVADRDSDPDATARRLETFLQRHPESPLADDAAEQRADIALARGDTEAARFWLRWLLEHQSGGDRADAARVKLARLEAREGNPMAARRLLEREVRWSSLSNPEKREGYRLAAELAEDPVASLRWLSALREATPEPERPPVDAEIAARVGVLSPDDLERAADQLRGGEAAGRVRLRRAERALEAGDVDQARKELRRAEDLDVSQSTRLALDAAAVRAETLARFAEGPGVLPTFEQVAALPEPSTAGAAGTIGVVLPLTGSLARYGEASLRGVLLAADIFEPVEGVPQRENRPPDAPPPASVSGGRAPVAVAPRAGRPGRVRVLVRDSGGSAERAARAVRELAARDDVVAIVGPLLSREAQSAARVAEEEDVPLLTLSARDEVARDRKHVFRLRTRAEDEVDALAEHATGALGARRFAILYPKDAYGRALRKMFWSAVEARGGQVVAVAGYETDATDFKEPIRRMVGYDLLTSAEKRALAARDRALDKARRLPPREQAEAREKIRSRPGPNGEPLPPIVDFDALFVPDSYEKIVLIAPQLAFHEVTGVKLLGPDGWDHPELLRIEGRHVDGALVATPFFEDSRFDFVTDFVARYRGAYGEHPDAFAAAAYDAANLVLVQLAYGARDREALREGLLRTHGYPGVSGVTTILPDGNARKRPFLLRVERESFVGVD